MEQYIRNLERNEDSLRKRIAELERLRKNDDRIIRNYQQLAEAAQEIQDSINCWRSGVMDVLTDPMLASQFGRLERRIEEFEAENQRLREALSEISTMQVHDIRAVGVARAALLEDWR